MTSRLTANQLSGRAISSLFFAGFGALWLSLSLYVRGSLNALSIATVSIGLLLLVSAALWLIREARRFPKMPEDPAQGRAFNRINAIQWIAVAVVAVTLSRFHLEIYIPSAIAAIVGLHLFPLARLFGYPLHHVTALALVLWATACLLFVPVDNLQGLTALGTGVILWISAVVSLAIGARVTRRGEIAGHTETTGAANRTSAAA